MLGGRQGKMEKGSETLDCMGGGRKRGAANEGETGRGGARGVYERK